MFEGVGRQIAPFSFMGAIAPFARGSTTDTATKWGNGHDILYQR